MSYLDLSSAPDNPVERLAWLSGIDQALRREVNLAWQEAYYEARIQGMFEAALALKFHPKKRALAWTRHENEARGRAISKWGDEY